MRTLLVLLTVVTLSATLASAASPPPAAHPTPPTAGTLILDLVDVPLADALSVLARTARVNLMVQGTVTGTVTLHVAGQTFDQALAMLANSYRLDVSRVGTAYMVRQLSGDAIRVAPTQAGSKDVVVRTYHLRYALASDVAAEIRALVGIKPKASVTTATVIGQPPTAPQGSGTSGSSTGTTSGTNTSTSSGVTSGSTSGGGTNAGTVPSVAAATQGAQSAQQTDQQASEKGVAVAIDDRTNSITVAAPFDMQLQVQDAILRLDRPTSGPQVVTPNGTDPAPGAGANSTITGVETSPGTYRYDIKFADPGSMAAAIMAEVTGVSGVVVDLRTNSVYVTGDASVQREVTAVLRALDSPAVQIMIQTEILDISRSAASQIGVQWDWQPFQISQLAAPSAELQGSGVYPITATLSALVSRGEGRVLANPRVATTNGVQAQINVGETLYIPITTTTSGVSTTTLTTVNAGIDLLVTPRLNGDRSITNAINVSANSLNGYTTQGYPDIMQRSVSSIVTVRDGEPIVIGGLISDTTTRAMQKIPVLGDLPVIGQLFRYTSTNYSYDNIVMVVTPRLLTPGAHAGMTVGSGSVTH